MTQVSKGDVLVHRLHLLSGHGVLDVAGRPGLPLFSRAECVTCIDATDWVEADVGGTRLRVAGSNSIRFGNVFGHQIRSVLF